MKGRLAGRVRFSGFSGQSESCGAKYIKLFEAIKVHVDQGVLNVKEKLYCVLTGMARCNNLLKTPPYSAIVAVKVLLTKCRDTVFVDPNSLHEA
jgi:hypothetical protein